MELPQYFDALMNRAPISSADVCTYLREMRRTPQGPLVTSKLIASKIQCPSEAQAIHAFEFLEAGLDSETEGSIEFRTEIGRYRFLNEIIRILSPKYLGDVTPVSVKDRAVKFLMDASGPKKPKWFPSEHSKITCVFTSLIDTGIIQKPLEEDGVDATEAELQKSIFDRAENASILKKLLTSKDAADLQAANRLIKNLVEEEAKRNERRAELHSLIDRIETSTTLLTEMLSQASLDKEIVDDLVTTCESLRKKLGSCATETIDETTSVLQASENIENALKLYEDRKKNGIVSTGDLLNNGTSPAKIPTSTLESTLSLADELLIGLSEDFAAPVAAAAAPVATNEHLLLNLDVEIHDRGDGPHTGEVEKPKPKDTLDEIERLSRELMEQSLQNSKSNSFVPSKKTAGASLSQLKKSSSIENGKSVSKNPPTETTATSFLDLDFLEQPKTGNSIEKVEAIKVGTIKKSPRGSTSNEDELLLSLETKNNNSAHVSQASANQNDFKVSSVKEVDLEKIDLFENVGPIELKLVDDEGVNCTDVSVTVTVGKVPEFPPTVLLAVVTLANRNHSAQLDSFLFQLAPPKGMQVKLLPASRQDLPPWKKTFLPPPVLTQVALVISNQRIFAENKTKLKFILSYCLGEDNTALFNGHFELPQINN